MGFSRETREEILIKAARSCSVCHQQKGVRIELHHIIPKEQGGTDNKENAIALCFDCHADAGHYNPKHPRGTKFSPTELRKHKIAWEDNVERGHVSKATTENNHLVVRHYFCLAWDGISEIAEINLSNFPISNVLILNNEVLVFLNNLLQAFGGKYRTSKMHGSSYSTPDEIKKNFPSLKEVDKRIFPSFDYQRELLNDDVSTINDYVLNSLLEDGVPLNELGQVLYYYDGGCGEEGYHELFNYLHVGFLLVAIENVSDKPCKLDNYHALSRNGAKFSPISLTELDDMEKKPFKFPNTLIKPGESVLIPQGVFTSLLDPSLAMSIPSRLLEDSLSSSQQELDDIAHWQNTSRIYNPKPKIASLRFLGPIHYLKELFYRINRKNFSQEVERFNFVNYYEVNRFWDCGSCPHIFIKNSAEAKWKYFGEALTSQNEEKKEFKIDFVVEEIMFAEIEHETSCFKYITILDKCGEIKLTCKEFTLEQGEVKIFRIPKATEYPITINLSGFYTPKTQVSYEAESKMFRNSIIRNFLHYISDPIFPASE